MKKHRVLITCSCLAVVAVAAIGFGGIFLLTRTLTMRLDRMKAFGPIAARLPDELASAEREGLPLSPADLKRVPPVAPARDAAPLYVRIDRILKGRSKVQQTADQDAETRLLSTARKGLDRAAIEALLSRHAEVIRLAEQAAALPDCDFQRHYELGPRLMLPEYASMREAVRLLALRAYVESADGRLEAAFASISAGARIGQHSGADPGMIPMLVRIALNAIMDRAFQDVVLAHIESRYMLRFARRCAGDLGAAPELRQAMRGEVILGRVAVDDIRRERSRLESLPLPPGLRAQSQITRATLCDAWEVRAISYWRRVNLALRQNQGDPMAQYRAYKAICDEEQANQGKPTYELNEVLMPVFSKAQLKVIGDEARRRLRIALLAVVAYRQAHGAFPGRLTYLGGRAPLDPFTNQSLIYRREGAGFVLYSVGENMKDDGGTEKGPKPDDKMMDIVVRYPVRQ